MWTQTWKGKINDGATSLSLYMRVGNALYPEDHLLIELYIFVLCETDYCALASLEPTHCNF
jgi:hypothetical protein